MKTLGRAVLIALLSQLAAAVVLLSVAYVLRDCNFQQHGVSSTFGAQLLQHYEYSPKAMTAAYQALTDLNYLSHLQWMLEHASFLFTAPPFIAVIVFYMRRRLVPERMSAASKVFSMNSQGFVWMSMTGVGFLLSLAGILGFQARGPAFLGEVVLGCIFSLAQFLIFPVNIGGLLLLILAWRLLPPVWEPRHWLCLLPLAFPVLCLMWGAYWIVGLEPIGAQPMRYASGFCLFWILFAGMPVSALILLVWFDGNRRFFLCLFTLQFLFACFAGAMSALALCGPIPAI